MLETATLRLGETDPDLELTLSATAAMLRICANAPAWTSAVVIADFEGLAGETSAERAMLAACAPHMTLTGAGTAKRVTDVCGRALALSAHECDGSLTADYLACRVALLAEATDTVELVLARAPGQPPTGAPDDRTLSALVLRCQLACRAVSWAMRRQMLAWGSASSTTWPRQSFIAACAAICWPHWRRSGSSAAATTRPMRRLAQ